MQVKHTFLLIFVVALVYVGVSFARSAGGSLIVGANAVFAGTDACSCHTFPSTPIPLITGLPAQWAPNTLYHLRVTVPTAGVKYGFQLSAVYDATTTQAGDLSIDPGSAPATVVSGSGLQFADHFPATGSNVFLVDWLSPSTPGDVRINVGAVRANGDGTRNGDTAFSDVRIIPALSATPPPAISAVESIPGGSGTATMTWTTDVASDSQVEFGTTTAYGQSTIVDGAMVTSHAVDVLGRSPTTTNN